MLNIIAQKDKIEQLDSVYRTGNFLNTIVLADSFLISYPENREFNLYKGMAFVEMARFKEAIPPLNKASKIVFDDSDTIASYAIGYLACCNFILNGDKIAEETIKKAYKANGTFHTEKFINSQSILFGFEDFYDDWYAVNTEYFNFWFQDTLNKNVSRFISKHELAFDSIMAFFASNIPRKINFFVWKSIEHAIETLYVKPAFASPVYCCIHSNYNESIGHEITHVISWYSTDIQHVTKLIFEGAAVYFDLTQRDRKDFVQAYIRHHQLKRISIKLLWENWQFYPQELSYPLGGILVERLIETYGRDKFLEFFSNQTYDNAIKVFGPSLNGLISDLEIELE